MSKKENKKSWYDVTLAQFNALQEINNIEDETERMFQMAEVIFGQDVSDMPLPEFAKKVGELTFLQEEVPIITLPKKIVINDRKYYIDCLLGHITTAQYVDYQNHSVTGEFNKMLSVFIIPSGHTYNDGYDMLQVMNDLLDLPVPIAYSAAFFFAKQFKLFMKIFRRYSIKQLKKTNLTKEEKEAIEKMVKSFSDMAFFPLFSNFAK